MGDGVMREFDRIDRIMRLLQRYWEEYPMLRFNQLIESLSWEYVKNVDGKYIETYQILNSIGNNVKGFNIENIEIPRLFYLEDDEFEKFLEEKVSGLK